MVKPYLSRLRPAETGPRLHPRPRSRFEPAPALPIDGPAIGSLGLSLPPESEAGAVGAEMELEPDTPYPYLAGSAVAATPGNQSLPPVRIAAPGPDTRDEERPPARAARADEPPRPSPSAATTAPAGASRAGEPRAGEPRAGEPRAGEPRAGGQRAGRPVGPRRSARAGHAGRRRRTHPQRESRRAAAAEPLCRGHRVRRCQPPAHAGEQRGGLPAGPSRRCRQRRSRPGAVECHARLCAPAGARAAGTPAAGTSRPLGPGKPGNAGAGADGAAR